MRKNVANDLLSSVNEDEDFIRLLAPSDPAQCPDVYFYLIKGLTGFDRTERIISFRKFEWIDLISNHGIQSKPQWHEFKECPLLTKLDEAEGAGDVLLGICACKYKQRQEFESKISQQYEQAFDTVTNTDEKGSDNHLDSDLDIDSKKLCFVERPFRAEMGNSQNIQCSITVTRATNIPVVDKDGASSPFVTLTIDGVKYETQVKKHTLAPQWNESFIFNNINIHSRLTFKLYSWNRFYSDKLLGMKKTKPRKTQEKQKKNVFCCVV